jgi:chromosome segregation ATPase
MEKKVRLIVILLSSLLVLFFCSAILLGIIAQREKTQRIELSELLDRTTKEKQVVEKRLAEINKIKSELESSLREAEGKIADLIVKLEEAESAKTALSSELSEREKVIGDLNAKFESEKREKAELADRLTKSEEEYKTLKAQVEQLETLKVELERKLQEAATKGVQLEKIVVKPKEALPQEETAPSIEGKILVVNREFDFVVINLGQRDGVELGTIFLVYRDGESLGKVQAEKVYEGMSTAIFLPEARKEEIREGDSVRILVSP